MDASELGFSVLRIASCSVVGVPLQVGGQDFG